MALSNFFNSIWPECKHGMPVNLWHGIVKIYVLLHDFFCSCHIMFFFLNVYSCIWTGMYSRSVCKCMHASGNERDEERSLVPFCAAYNLRPFYTCMHDALWRCWEMEMVEGQGSGALLCWREKDSKTYLSYSQTMKPTSNIIC